MSSITYLYVHQSEDVVFDDISVLNADLDALGGTRELLNPEEFEYWSAPRSELNGFIKQDASGKVLITGRMDGEFEGYSNAASVYSCVYRPEFDMIAKHIVSGKLVFRYDYEGDDNNEIFILTPGKVEETSMNAVKF